MAGFEGTLSDADTWPVIHFMKAQGAGQALKAAGFWPQPVPVPDFDVRCDGKPLRGIASWHGQRLRQVAAGDGAEVLEDGRLVTVRTIPPGAVVATASALPADGMSALIAGMDAEPVRYVKDGFVRLWWGGYAGY